jgi:hypothetical protein
MNSSPMLKPIGSIGSGNDNVTLSSGNVNDNGIDNELVKPRGNNNSGNELVNSSGNSSVEEWSNSILLTTPFVYSISDTNYSSHSNPLPNNYAQCYQEVYKYLMKQGKPKTVKEIWNAKRKIISSLTAIRRDCLKLTADGYLLHDITKDSFIAIGKKTLTRLEQTIAILDQITLTGDMLKNNDGTYIFNPNSADNIKRAEDREWNKYVTRESRDRFLERHKQRYIAKFGTSNGKYQWRKGNRKWSVRHFIAGMLYQAKYVGIVPSYNDLYQPLAMYNTTADEPYTEQKLHGRVNAAIEYLYQHGHLDWIEILTHGAF